MIRKSEGAKPCPHCGCDKIFEVVDNPSDDFQEAPIIGDMPLSRSYNIHCDVCGALAPHLTAWNSRFPDEVHPIIAGARTLRDLPSCNAGVLNTCAAIGGKQ